ncbi:hypothetical protein [Streptomyces sp. C36]|uniref:hypothetical protein n=1 Tax=Streptomyces sp. C36 TaxID=3237122 RepID=UPI0034C5FAAA
MSTHRERIQEAREAERRVLAANNARAALAHERKALAVLAAVEAGEERTALGLNPQAVDELVEEARRLAPVPPGRLGRSPRHVIDRYAAGEISRDEMVQALSTWPYRERGPIVEGMHDDLAVVEEGTFDEVQIARDQRYIDDEAFYTIVRHLAAQR